jgi:hypothetical protein
MAPRRILRGEFVVAPMMRRKRIARRADTGVGINEAQRATGAHFLQRKENQMIEILFSTHTLRAARCARRVQDERDRGFQSHAHAFARAPRLLF